MMRIVGNHETVAFPDFGIDAVVAKIDTGADSGAFHSGKITEFTKNGIPMLSFAPFDHPELVIETAKFSKKQVKSSNGMAETRYFVTTTLIIQDEVLQATLSLSDRSQMKYPVLIGSKFLKEHNFIVDVNLNTV